MLYSFFVKLFELPVGWHGHGPVEFVSEGLGEHLVDGHFAALAPGHRDARVHVVDLTGAQGHLFVLVAVADVHFELAQVLGPLRDAAFDRGQGRHGLVLVLLFESALLVL